MANIALPVLTDTGLSRYISEINKAPLLEEDEEYILATRWKEDGDINSAHKLVTSHLRLVVKVAMGFRGYGLPLVEMISEGNIGLMQAVKRFEPEKGFRLSTYALWWIKAAIHEYVLRSWSLVKIGTTAAQKKLFFNLKRIKRRISVAHDKDLTNAEARAVAEELDVSEKEVIEMDQRLNFGDASLNAPLSSEGESGEWMDFLEDDAQTQETIYGEEEDMNWKREAFSKAFEKLNDRERHIIQARKLAEKPATLEELSQFYNISRERVRQVEARALEKLSELVQEPKEAPQEAAVL